MSLEDATLEGRAGRGNGGARAAEDRSPSQILDRWLGAFDKAITAADRTALEALFDKDSYWRDQIGLTWDMRQYWGRDALLDPLLDAVYAMRPTNFRVAPLRTAPTMVDFLDEQVLEAFCDFDLPHGVGQAMVRLRPDGAAPAGALCYTLGTDLKSVDGVEERHARKVTPEAMEPVFPIHGFEPDMEGQTWPEHLGSRSAFAAKDPDVLIIGGGHSGVMVGARLHAMRQSYLILDNPSAGVGDEVSESNVAAFAVTRSV